MKKLLALALVTSISLPLMAAETAPATTPKAPNPTQPLTLSTPIAGGVTVGTGLAIGAGVIAAGVAASNSGGGGNDNNPGTGGTTGTTGTTGTQ